MFRKDRPKHQNARKSSAVLVKECLRNYCKFDPLSDSDVISVRVQKQITTCDLFIGFVYLPPVNSTYGKAHETYRKFLM